MSDTETTKGYKRRTPFKVAVGERLRARRKAMGAEQQDIAEAIHHSRGAYALWESGANAVPPEYLLPLSKALGVKVEWILGDETSDDDLDLDERDILRYYRGTPPNLRPAGKAALRALFEEQDRRENQGTIGKRAED